MDGYPTEYDSQYLEDYAKWGSRPLDNPESPIPDKVGTLDTSETGYLAVCGGFMGNESLISQHYCNTVQDGITWLTNHGCTRIVNLCDNSVL